MASQISKEQIARAMRDPAEVFSAPADVLSADGVSQKEKIDILRRWEYDAREELVADEEGFAGNAPGALLDDIVAALHSLGTGPDVEHSPPTKAGGV